MAVLEIINTGTGLSVQDGGRPGWRRYGVPPGGAMDRYAARWANRLLGNRDTAPTLEVLLQGAKLRVLESIWIAVAGGDLGASIAPWSARLVAAGEVLHFKKNSGGLWAYVAVPGGFAVDCWMGSASVDARNGLGALLRKGDQLSAVMQLPRLSTEQVGGRSLIPEAQRDYRKPPVFTLLRGPEFERFPPAAADSLVEAKWKVTSQLDRTGYRLEGPALPVPESIKSGPVLPGSFQIPGNGQPIVTMPDGPTVGGYPKLAVLKESELNWIAQCRPGMEVAFRWAD